MPFFQSSRFWVVALVLTLSLCVAPVRAADNTAESRSSDPSSTSNQDALRSNLEIQGQLHDALLAIEKNRKEAEAAAARNAALMEERMTLLEKTLAAERQAELQNMENSDRMMLIAAGSFAAVGFLVLAAAAFLQWNGANRLAKLAASVSAGNGLALENGEAQAAMSRALEQANARFLSIIERLDERAKNLELAAPPVEKALTNGTNGNGNGNGNGDHAVSELKPSESMPSLDADPAEAIRLLLAKGQTLLKLDKADDALNCFNEVLAIDGAHPEALVKKGAALERLQRLDEAVECYDQAIAQDNSLTMAYLYKGGVFNRMARYSEALACYEQALKSQQKGHAANVIMD